MMTVQWHPVLCLLGAGLRDPHWAPQGAKRRRARNKLSIRSIFARSPQRPVCVQGSMQLHANPCRNPSRTSAACDAWIKECTLRAPLWLFLPFSEGACWFDECLPVQMYVTGFQAIVSIPSEHAMWFLEWKEWHERCCVLSGDWSTDQESQRSCLHSRLAPNFASQNVCRAQNQAPDCRAEWSFCLPCAEPLSPSSRDYPEKRDLSEQSSVDEDAFLAAAAQEAESARDQAAKKHRLKSFFKGEGANIRKLLDPREHILGRDSSEREREGASSTGVRLPGHG